MTEEQFRDFGKKAWRTAKILLVSQGWHAPQVLAFDAQDKLTLAVIKHNKPGQQLWPAVKEILHKHHAVAFLFISEAWTKAIGRHLRPELVAQAARLYGGRVHEQPDRKEALWLCAVHPRWAGGYALEFSHDADGQIRFGIERELRREDIGGEIIKLLSH
jgi:hypothetical protein